MILSQIKNNITLRAINEHNISEEKLQEFDTIQELRKFINKESKQKWVVKNKKYFQNTYQEKYKPKAKERYDERKEYLTFFRNLPRI